MKKVSEIAKIFNVTDQSVRKWLKDGLKFDVLKEPGFRSYVVIDPIWVEDYQKSKAEFRKAKLG